MLAWKTRQVRYFHDGSFSFSITYHGIEIDDAMVSLSSYASHFLAIFVRFSVQKYCDIDKKDISLPSHERSFD